MDARWLGILSVVLMACAQVDPREALILSAMVDWDEPYIRSRPELSYGKYVRMANDPYAFYRAAVPVFRRDVDDSSSPVGRSGFGADALPLSLGDAHVENFGLLRASDGSFSLEPNDFDASDRLPYHWDLRRLTVGMIVAARLSNADDETAHAAAVAATRTIVEATARAYAEQMIAYRDGAPRLPVDDADPTAISALIDDAFDRGRDDQPRGTTPGEELDEITEIVDGRRRLLRGNADAEELENVYEELPPFARDGLPAMLEEYRRSLIDPPPPEYFTVLDAIREHATGIASWARIRLLVLVRGESDEDYDDVILEVKELLDSGSPGFRPPFVYSDTVQQRVSWATRHAWSRPDADPLWGPSTFVGIPVQVRREAEMHKTLRIARIVDGEGTPEDIALTGEVLARLLARVHASTDVDPHAARAIADAIERDLDGFVAQERDVAIAYADQIEADWRYFRNGLLRLGPRLGVPLDPYDRDRASADWQALYGSPVPPPDILDVP